MQGRVTLDHPGLADRVRHDQNRSAPRAQRGSEPVLAHRAAAARGLKVPPRLLAQKETPPQPKPQLEQVVAEAPKIAKQIIKPNASRKHKKQRAVFSDFAAPRKVVKKHPEQKSAFNEMAKANNQKTFSDIAPATNHPRPIPAKRLPVDRAQAIAAPVQPAVGHEQEIIERVMTEPEEKVSFWDRLKSFNIKSASANASPWMANSVYAMAIIVFGIGVGVAVDGYLSNRAVDQQVAGLSTSEGGQPGALGGGFIPNENPVNNTQIGEYQVAPHEPRYLRIPSIGVGTTRVLEKGLTRDGAIDTPRGIYDVSWYANSAAPSDESGAMFISGHYVGPSQPGVFFHLQHIKEGAIVEVEQGDGTIHEFKVVKIVEFELDDVNMAQALSPVNPDKLGLNIMTCGGEWDTSIGLYDKRTLVMTEKVDS